MYRSGRRYRLCQGEGSGIDFIIIRAGYGAGHKDKWFEANYKKAKQAGLHVGAYCVQQGRELLRSRAVRRELPFSSQWKAV